MTREHECRIVVPIRGHLGWKGSVKLDSRRISDDCQEMRYTCKRCGQTWELMHSEGMGVYAIKVDA